MSEPAKPAGDFLVAADTLARAGIGSVADAIIEVTSSGVLIAPDTLRKVYVEATSAISDRQRASRHRVNFSALGRLGTVLLCTLLAACTEPAALQQLKGFAQGTSYHISYWSASPLDPQALKKSVENEFAAIDRLLSNYRPDSVIEAFNSNATTTSQTVGPEIVQLVRIAETVHKASQGCYDLTIKPLFTLWGFDGETPAIPNDKSINDALKQMGMAQLTTVDDTHLSKKQAALKVDLSSV